MVFTDNELTDKKFQKELNSGTAALVLLAVLDRADEPMYGYQIAKHLDTGSEEVPVKQGALYPVLRSLEAGDFGKRGRAVSFRASAKVLPDYRNRTRDPASVD